ncbi:hypothetical protein A8N28_004846 [Salmonella enterica]|nr:hypothetical protein [Salmonella enterica]EKT7778756.1 hypothetical protein [Salmonella enterica]
MMMKRGCIITVIVTMYPLNPVSGTDPLGLFVPLVIAGYYISAEVVALASSGLAAVTAALSTPSGQQVVQNAANAISNTYNQIASQAMIENPGLIAFVAGQTATGRSLVDSGNVMADSYQSIFSDPCGAFASVFGDDESVNNTGGDQLAPQLPGDTGGDQLPPPLTDNTGHDGGINGTDSTLPGYGEDPVDLGPNDTGYPQDNIDIPNVMTSNGADRSQKYSSNWATADLDEAIKKFAGENPIINVTDKGKRIYTNPDTSIQVVEDMKGKYFRIYDPNHSGKRAYMDVDGNIPNNKMENGKETGRSQGEYNEVTHFNIGGRK